MWNAIGITRYKKIYQTQITSISSVFEPLTCLTWKFCCIKQLIQNTYVTCLAHKLLVVLKSMYAVFENRKQVNVCIVLPFIGLTSKKSWIKYVNTYISNQKQYYIIILLLPVVNRSISDAKNENDACLSYRCSREGPIFTESDCYKLHCKPYCREYTYQKRSEHFFQFMNQVHFAIEICIYQTLNTW